MKLKMSHFQQGRKKSAWNPSGSNRSDARSFRNTHSRGRRLSSPRRAPCVAGGCRTRAGSAPRPPGWRVQNSKIQAQRGGGQRVCFSDWNANSFLAYTEKRHLYQWLWWLIKNSFYMGTGRLRWINRLRELDIRKTSFHPPSPATSQPPDLSVPSQCRLSDTVA